MIHTVPCIRYVLKVEYAREAEVDSSTECGRVEGERDVPSDEGHRDDQIPSLRLQLYQHTDSWLKWKWKWNPNTDQGKDYINVYYLVIS